MIMKSFKARVGALDLYTNMYVVADEKTKEGILIDAAAATRELVNYIDVMGIKLRYIVLTHCHSDHTTGLKELKKEYPRVPIVINEDDKEGLTLPSINLSDWIGVENNYIEADITVKEGDVLKFGELEAQIIHTPGHTAGSMCILIKDALFSGDTMFKHTYGRTDLETGSDREIMWSIKDKLLHLPDETIVYPGHGATTIIKDEKEIYEDRD